MALEETIREMIKEELKAQLGEQFEELSSLSSRMDALERELKEKWDLVLSLRKNTLDQLMLEYRNLKEPKSQDVEI